MSNIFYSCGARNSDWILMEFDPEEFLAEVRDIFQTDAAPELTWVGGRMVSPDAVLIVYRHRSVAEQWGVFVDVDGFEEIYHPARSIRELASWVCEEVRGPSPGYWVTGADWAAGIADDGDIIWRGINPDAPKLSGRVMRWEPPKPPERERDPDSVVSYGGSFTPLLEHRSTES